MRERLKLSQQFLEAAGKARQEAEEAASLQMPDQLGGKVLTATLKNGKALCPEFQMDECPNNADDYPFGAHLRAVLQQSGRLWRQTRGRGMPHQKGSYGSICGASHLETISYPGTCSLG